MTGGQSVLEEYLRYAEQCLAIARTVNSREARITLREMAAEWTNLAQLPQKPQHPLQAAE
jgi:hypothetical protein